MGNATQHIIWSSPKLKSFILQACQGLYHPVGVLGSHREARLAYEWERRWPTTHSSQTIWSQDPAVHLNIQLTMQHSLKEAFYCVARTLW